LKPQGAFKGGKGGKRKRKRRNIKGGGKPGCSILENLTKRLLTARKKIWEKKSQVERLRVDLL